MSQRILVVDDDEDIVRVVRVNLELEGFEVSTAFDGVEGVQAVERAAPDLVLLDIMMPRMDGIECCRKIKENDLTRDVKVVMVTTKSEYERVREAFAAGCDDYVTKPIDKTELITKVQELLDFQNLRQLLRD